MSETKNRFIVVRMPSRLADDLERRADTEGRSRSEVVRDALAAHVRPSVPGREIAAA